MKMSISVECHCEHKYRKNETFTKIYPKACIFKLLKLYQLCHIFKILLVIYYFCQFSEILNLTKI